MTVVFTEQELMWINKDFNHWTVKNDCPVKIRDSIQVKLNTLYSFPDRVNRKEDANGK